MRSKWERRDRDNETLGLRVDPTGDQFTWWRWKVVNEGRTSIDCQVS